MESTYFNVCCPFLPLYVEQRRYDVMSTKVPGKLISLLTWNKVWGAGMFSLITQRVNSFTAVGEKTNNMTHSFLIEASRVDRLIPLKMTLKFTCNLPPLLRPAGQQPTQGNQQAGFLIGEMKEVGMCNCYTKSNLSLLCLSRFQLGNYLHPLPAGFFNRHLRHYLLMTGSIFNTLPYCAM